MNLTQETKLKDVILSNPAAAPILEKAGMDYCCGGKQTVGEACLKAGMPAEVLLERLREAKGQISPELKDWTTATMGELARHIVNKHHSYVREANPRISDHLAKVAQKHGDNHPETQRIQDLFEVLANELMQHMQKEEMIVFPYVEQMSAAAESGTKLHPPFFGTVQNPVAMMIKEHDSAGELIGQIKELSGSFTAPADACTTFALVYRELEEYDHDLRLHIHLENNILFPRAVEMEAQITGH
jgi:regulator of cell morphogenesis and NO signaling